MMKPKPKHKAQYRNGREWLSDGKFPSMWALCESLLDRNPVIRYEDMEQEVKKHFPNAEFNLSRWYWVRSKWKRGIRSKRKLRGVTKVVPHAKLKEIEKKTNP